MPLAREIYQEGIRIPPVRLVRGGKLDRELLDLMLGQRAHAGGARGRSAWRSSHRSNGERSG